MPPKYNLESSKQNNILIYKDTKLDDRIELQIAESSNNTITVIIINLLGQEITSYTFKLNGEYQILDIPIAELINGTYIYTISSGGYLFDTIKFNIVK